MQYRHVVSVITAFILLGLSCTPATAWGPTGHTLVTQSALTLLPAQIKPLYDANARYIVALVTLPDDWKQTHRFEEDSNHFIDMDLLAKPPFAELMGDRASVEKRFGKGKLNKAGVLPWTIAERYNKLVSAFKKKDSQEIVVQSALLAHYIGDAHVPFHATQYYNGKTPEQKGIHFRWEENLIALTVKPEQIRPTQPEKVTDILHSALGWCTDSYNGVDTILWAEDKARERDPNHGYAYYTVLSEGSGALLNKQLTTAAEALAGACIAAWKAAGSPQLDARPASLFWGE